MPQCTWVIWWLSVISLYGFSWRCGLCQLPFRSAGGGWDILMLWSGHPIWVSKHSFKVFVFCFVFCFVFYWSIVNLEKNIKKNVLLGVHKSLEYFQRIPGNWALVCLSPGPSDLFLWHSLGWGVDVSLVWGKVLSSSFFFQISFSFSEAGTLGKQMCRIFAGNFCSFFLASCVSPPRSNEGQSLLHS